MDGNDAHIAQETVAMPAVLPDGDAGPRADAGAPARSRMLKASFSADLDAVSAGGFAAQLGAACARAMLGRGGADADEDAGSGGAGFTEALSAAGAQQATADVLAAAASQLDAAPAADATADGGPSAPGAVTDPGQVAASESLKRAKQRRGRARGGRIRLALSVLLIVAGLCVLAYPIVSSYLNQQARGEVVAAQKERIQKTSVPTLSDELSAAEEYNEELRESRARVTDPFDPAAEVPSTQRYEELLNLDGDGVMGTVSVPSAHIQLPIYHGVDDASLQRGAGHLPGTSLPVGGAGTHAVITGHTGLPSARMFDALDQLQVGDWFVVSVLGRDLAYSVYQVEVVTPEQTESLSVQSGADLVTLVTCTPYGVNSHRLLVHAQRTTLPPEWKQGAAQAQAAAITLDPTSDMLFFGLSGAAVAVLGVVLFALIHLRARRA